MGHWDEESEIFEPLNDRVLAEELQIHRVVKDSRKLIHIMISKSSYDGVYYAYRGLGKYTNRSIICTL